MNKHRRMTITLGYMKIKLSIKLFILERGQKASVEVWETDGDGEAKIDYDTAS